MQTHSVENATSEALPLNKTTNIFQEELEEIVGRRVSELVASHLVDYEIQKPKEVAEYLSTNLYLVDMLEEIPSKIRFYFGDEQKLRLRVSRDPEDPTWITLIVSVPTNLSSEEAFPLMERFDEEWLYDEFDRTRGNLLTKLDYVK